jgi:hypothetical protein
VATLQPLADQCSIDGCIHNQQPRSHHGDHKPKGTVNGNTLQESEDEWVSYPRNIIHRFSHTQPIAASLACCCLCTQQQATHSKAKTISPLLTYSVQQAMQTGRHWLGSSQNT